MLQDRPLTHLNIGLDYDDTFTQDPGLWRAFVGIAKERGHCVYVTTARHASDIADIEMNLPGIEVIPSGGKCKNPAAQAAGVSIDIWIDDMPQIIMEELWQPATAP